jgi:hypothetical protein
MQAGAYTSKAGLTLLVLPTNIRLGLKGLPPGKTLQLITHTCKLWTWKFYSKVLGEKSLICCSVRVRSWRRDIQRDDTQQNDIGQNEMLRFIHRSVVALCMLFLVSTIKLLTAVIVSLS